MIRTLAIAAALLAPIHVSHADEGEATSAGQALRVDSWLSSDADGQETRKFGLGWDVRRTSDSDWWGVKVERARFSGDGWSSSEQRAYLRAAGGEDWRWKVDAGSNGDTLLGSAAIHSQDPRRKEFFIEREVLDTRAGVRDGRVHTFVGGAIDLPVGERWSTTFLLGAQDFAGGDNLRTHLRANVVRVLLPAHGLSLQLRTRYFRNSDPYEGDYYSPPWHAEALGVLAWRRHVGGYRWSAAAGWGRQRAGDGDSARARMLQLGLETPSWKQASLRVTAGYMDTPVLADAGSIRYAYRYLALDAVMRY